MSGAAAAAIPGLHKLCAPWRQQMLMKPKITNPFCIVQHCLKCMVHNDSNGPLKLSPSEPGPPFCHRSRACCIQDINTHELGLVVNWPNLQQTEIVHTNGFLLVCTDVRHISKLYQTIVSCIKKQMVLKMCRHHRHFLWSSEMIPAMKISCIHLVSIYLDLRNNILQKNGKMAQIKRRPSANQ